MNRLEPERDSQIYRLELEWRRAYEDSIAARADYQALAATPAADANRLDLAREALDRAEARKADLTARIERLEYELLGQD